MAYILDTTHDPGFIDLHKVLLGDINGDNIVDGSDFDTWFTHLQSATPTYEQGDLNGGNGTVANGADFDPPGSPTSKIPSRAPSTLPTRRPRQLPVPGATGNPHLTPDPQNPPPSPSLPLAALPPPSLRRRRRQPT